MNVSEINPCDYNETVPQETFQLITLGYIALELILGVFIGFGNILVLAAFCKFRELRTSMNVFVVALALADLAVALIAFPIHIAIFVFPVLKNVFFICMLRYSILVISGGSSALLLIVISIDRYLAIEKPLEYLKIMTTGKAKLISVGVLLYQLSLSSIPFLGWNEWSPCVECTFTLVLPRMYITWIVITLLIGAAFVGILNIKIFFTANKASAGIHARIVSISRKTFVAKGKSFIQNKRAMKALLMMFSAYTVCVLPLGVFTLWEIYSLDETSYQQYDAVRTGATLLALINSGLNPLIYHRRIPEFNSAFRSLLGLKTISRRVQTPRQEQLSHTNTPLDLHTKTTT